MSGKKIITLSKLYKVCFSIYNLIHSLIINIHSNFELLIEHLAELNIFISEVREICNNIPDFSYFISIIFITKEIIYFEALVDMFGSCLINNYVQEAKLVYNFNCFERNFRIIFHLDFKYFFIDLSIKNNILSFPLFSIVKLFKNANWLERENFDMFGIYFKKHPDLRRLLTDYCFTGHPLQKNFPLTGTAEIIYCDAKKRLINIKTIEFTQAYRFFVFKNLLNSNLRV